MFYQLRSSALLEFIPLSDVSIRIRTVASQVFLSDQLCPVAWIIQALKAGNMPYRIGYIHYFWILHSMMKHTNQDEDEGADFKRKASNLEAKRKEEVN